MKIIKKIITKLYFKYCYVEPKQPQITFNEKQIVTLHQSIRINLSDCMHMEQDDLIDFIVSKFAKGIINHMYIQCEKDIIYNTMNYRAALKVVDMGDGNVNLHQSTKI